MRWYASVAQAVYVHEPPKPQPTARTVATCCNCSAHEEALLRTLPGFDVLSVAAYRQAMYTNAPLIPI